MWRKSFKSSSCQDVETASCLGGYSRLGERVMDSRITISDNPMDPELSFPPFNSYVDLWNDNDFSAEAYHAVTWIEQGILTGLSYDRPYAIDRLGRDMGLLPGAFRMSVTGITTTLDEMVSTTKRGLLVTRFDNVITIDEKSLLMRGYTRDGLWLIENGKIARAVKNLAFTESILFALSTTWSNLACHSESFILRQFGQEGSAGLFQ